MPKSVAFTQCTVRSTRSKRRIGGSPASWRASLTVTSGGIVVPSVGAADPAVDVVAAVFPVALFDVLRELDAVEPLERLVAVHRRDVEAYRPTVLVGEGVTLEAVGGDDVVAARLREREALGVRAVERVQAQCSRLRLHAGALEQ